MYTIIHFASGIPKKDIPSGCCNFDVHQPILIIFGKNVIDRAGSQTLIHFPLHLRNASAPGKTHQNNIFSLKCCITASPEFNQSLIDFCNFVDLRLMFMLL